MKRFPPLYPRDSEELLPSRSLTPWQEKARWKSSFYWLAVICAVLVVIVINQHYAIQAQGHALETLRFACR